MQRKQYQQEILPCVPDLSRTALRLTRGNALADDLVQETLVRAWQARESFRPGTNARAWTQRILFNTYVNHYRKRRREHEARQQYQSERDSLRSKHVPSMASDGRSRGGARYAETRIPRSRRARRPRGPVLPRCRCTSRLPRGHRDVPTPSRPVSSSESASRLRRGRGGGARSGVDKGSRNNTRQNRCENQGISSNAPLALTKPPKVTYWRHG